MLNACVCVCVFVGCTLDLLNYAVHSLHPSTQFYSGPFTLSQSFQLPAEMPQGNYDVQIKIRTADKRQVTCISVKLSV